VQGDFDHIVPVVSPALNTQSGSHHAPDTKAYVVVHGTQDPCVSTDTAFALGRNNGGENAIAYSIMPMNSGKDYKARETEVAQPIMAGGPVGGNQGGDYVVQPTIAIQDVRGTDKAQNGKGWSDEGASYTVDTHATQGVSKTVAARNDQDTASCVAFTARDYGADATENLAPTMRSLARGADGHQSGSHGLAVAFAQNTRDEVRLIGDDRALSLQRSQTQAIALQDVRGIKKAQNGRGWNDDGSAYTVDTRATQGVAYPVGSNQGGFTNSHQNGGVMPAVAIGFNEDGTARTLTARHDSSPCADRGPDVVSQTSAVRRLTPVECERLQGFPDNFTAIPWKKKGPEQCPDGPRYKALGNSMAVPVMRWIGERIQLVDDLISVL